MFCTDFTRTRLTTIRLTTLLLSLLLVACAGGGGGGGVIDQTTYPWYNFD
jgi:hypothetical protein